MRMSALLITISIRSTTDWKKGQCCTHEEKGTGTNAGTQSGVWGLKGGDLMVAAVGRTGQAS
jgi:hypothetical protein